MSKLTFLEKLGILVNLSITYKDYVLILAVLLMFVGVLSLTTKKNAKTNKVLYVLITFVIIGLLIASYHASLGNMFSYMMNNFFVAVYFPTIAIYLAALIAMNIVVWVSIFGFKSSKQIKTLNLSIYVIMNYILALLLKVINTNKLDIFDQASLYGNKETTALIELSSIIFMVWIVFLVLYKIILIYIKKDYKPTVKRIIVRKKVKKLPENYEPTNSPKVIYGKLLHKDTSIIDTSEKTEDEILLERFSKQFTLEDYKLFSRLLKEEQDRINNKKVDFIDVDHNVKVSKKKENKKKENTKKDSYREQQKQEIISLEEERRELLRKEQEKEIKDPEQVDEVFEDLIIPYLTEEEREQRKLSELEMLYR